MADRIFINLPVADVTAAAAFHEAIGFTRDPRFSNNGGASMTWSDAISVMLLSHALYATFTPKRIVDARAESQVLLAQVLLAQALLALSLDSREAVDAITAAALAVGGREAHGAEDHGFMDSRAFEDLDGHGWGPFWMNMAAFDAAQADRADAA